MHRDHHPSAAPNGRALRRGFGFRQLVVAVQSLLASLLLFTATCGAQSLPHTFTKVGPEYRLTLQPNPLLYFGFQHSSDLLQPFSYVAMALGTPGPVFGYTPRRRRTPRLLPRQRHQRRRAGAP